MKKSLAGPAPHSARGSGRPIDLEVAGKAALSAGTHPEKGASPRALLFPRTDLRYWKRYLIRRAYGRLVRPRPYDEFSVRIEHDGTRLYFPLDTGNEETAAARALKIYQLLLQEGWAGVFRRQAREFTLALCWSENPMVFTYTTLYSVPEEGADASPPRPLNRNDAAKALVGFIEPDGAIQRAIANWLEELPEGLEPRGFTSASEALDALRGTGFKLLLFNRHLPDVPTGELIEILRTRAPRLPVFGYRVYESSDEMFVSQPGLSGGYYFRRRPPEQLLEPMRGLWKKRNLTPTDCLAHVCRYVQKLFLFPLHPLEACDASSLTAREQDILVCLCRGEPDKEIARALNISTWTVHTHLKKIYEKLGAHSRTEAVIKYLQK